MTLRFTLNSKQIITCTLTELLACTNRYHSYVNKSAERFDTTWNHPFWSSDTSPGFNTDSLTKKWANPSTGVVHMYHSGGWGGWQFQVADRSATPQPPPPHTHTHTNPAPAPCPQTGSVASEGSSQFAIVTHTRSTYAVHPIACWAKGCTSPGNTTFVCLRPRSKTLCAILDQQVRFILVGRIQSPFFWGV